MATPVYCEISDVKRYLSQSGIRRDIDSGNVDMNEALPLYIAEAAAEARSYIRPRFDPDDIPVAPNSWPTARELNAALAADRFLKGFGNIDAERDGMVLKRLNRTIEHIRGMLQRGHFEDGDGALATAVIGVTTANIDSSTELEDAFA